MNSNFKSQSLLVVFFTLGLFGGCTDPSKLEEQQSQIDELKTTQIATINEQVVSILNTIGSLEKVDKELADIITTLQSELDQIDGNVVELQNIIDKLKETDANLDSRIYDLKSYCEQQNSSLKDWATITFSTLEQHGVVLTEIAGIKVSLSELSQTIAKLDSSLSDKISDAEARLMAEISNSESSVKEWVNEQLVGYYTIAQVEAKLKVLEDGYRSGDEASSSDISTLRQTLETVKSELTSAYQSAIVAAITENNGTINQKIATDIKTATDSFQEKIDPLSQRLALLEAAIDELKTTQIATINEQVANILTTIDNLDKVEKGLSSLITTLQSELDQIDGNVVELQKTIDSLKVANVDLISRINYFKSYCEQQDSSLKDWAATTFSTLEQQSTVLTEIAGIKVSLSELSQTIAKLDSSLSDKISDAKTLLVTDIKTASDSLQEQIDSLSQRLALLETNIGDLIGMVQSIVVVPDYSDGSVRITNGESNVIRFMVYPEGLASKLTEAGLSCFKVEAVYTITKSNLSFVNLPISKVTSNENIISVTVSGSSLDNAFFAGNISADAHLIVSYKSSNYSTPFFQLYTPGEADDNEAGVVTTSVLDLSFTKAVLIGSVVTSGAIESYGVCYSKESSICDNYAYSDNINDNGSFSVNLEGLESGVKYYYKAFAIIDGQACFSRVMNFTVPSAEGMVQTGNSLSISAISATLEGSLNSSILGESSIKYGFCYSTSNSIPDINSTVKYVSSISEKGAFNFTIQGLTPSTKYWYRSFLTVGGSTVYGDVRFFTTGASEAMVLTYDCSNLKYTSVTLNGKVLIDKTNYSSIVCGFELSGSIAGNEWDDYSDRTLVLSASSISDDGVFSVSQSGLQEHHSFSYRVVASIDGNTYYGDYVTFNTPEIIISSETVIDLGLSVKWASCSIGANYPYESGDFFAWGETETKSNFNWSTYKWCLGGNSSMLTKYNKDDNKTVLDLEDDVAHILLGGKWRMPTAEELDELLKNCSWEWTLLNGVKGYIITSNRTGYTDKFIFLPASGDKIDASLSGGDPHYWTSSLSTRNKKEAYEIDRGRKGEKNRCNGQPIRPVYDEKLSQ